VSVVHAGAVFLRSLLRTAPPGRGGGAGGPTGGGARENFRAAIGKKYTGHSCADRLTCDQSIPRTGSRLCRPVPIRGDRSLTSSLQQIGRSLLARFSVPIW